MASRTRSPHGYRDDRSRSRSRERSLTPRSRGSRSPSVDRSRNYANDRDRSPRRNGIDNARSLSRSRSYSRGRSPTRSRSRSRSRSDSPASPPLRSTKVRSPCAPLSSTFREAVLSNHPSLAQVVVERLTKNVNEDHLREIFGQYGEIEDLDLPLNRQCTLQSEKW